MDQAYQLMGPALFFLWLLAVAVGSRRFSSSWGWRAAALVGAAGLVLCRPLHGGLSGASLVLSFNPVFSAVTMAYMLEAIAGRWSGGRRGPLLGGGGDFNLCALALSLPVTASCLGLLPLDLYGAGYFEGVLVVAAAGAVLALRGSPGAWVFVFALSAFVLDLLPTSNVWDYVVDGPALFIAAFRVLGPLMRRREGAAPGGEDLSNPGRV